MHGHIDEITLADWMAGRFAGLPGDCGNEIAPVIDESPRNRDWSQRPSTKDQLRIEDFLSARLTARTRLLHVGIGNSRLAQRFCHEVASIGGVTITRAEQELALSLRLPGYAPRLLNKYSGAFARMGGSFDFIVDNNPSTFACCRRHFARLMLACKSMLAPGGLMLTDRAGLAHLADDAPELQRWSFSAEDWFALAEAMGMKASTHGEQVLAMEFG